MIAITNAQNIGFLKQVTTSKKKFNPTMQRQMKNVKWLHAHKRPHMDSNHKNTRHWMEYQKKLQYLCIDLLIKCVLCYPKSGNVAKHYKLISRQISNDCLTLSVLGY